MSKRELLLRGFRSWEDFFFQIMCSSRQEPHGCIDQFNELDGKQAAACLFYLHERRGDKDADNALEQIQSHIKNLIS